MIYLVTTVVLIFCSSILFIPKLKHFTHRNELASNFVLTLVATLIGVLLAITISNYDANEKEREDLIKLLYAAEAVVKESQDYSILLLEHYQERLSDSVSKEAKAAFFEKNPLVYPEYLDALMSQHIFIKNLSQESLTELSERLIVMKRAKSIMPELFVKSTSYVLYILEQERRYQQGEITLLELETLLDLKEDEIDARP
ncbi:hypothetical protein [Pseudoalteromonas luteoviolacea]|uniref:Uncharacterized protein n=1 Tax=Pseudoalteromonas luteoviolacea NCIMB 1942 TaxID=1365253 RepID=A0A167AJG6_9GAMM|nr:hypothetical protein [Pseudoalteromonas luteoviolacea]KZN45464.1 hypothetical protein N482_14590 [Pseudoalteromonas luteoviolacea NCIMB 1942]KZX02144.1 hypothetical protein JL49_02065 [Pseudoalteromonas luteoviolacea]